MTGMNFPWHDLSCQHVFCPTVIIYNSMTGWPKELYRIHFLSNVTVDSIRNLLPWYVICPCIGFTEGPLNLLPLYVILHCIGFREGPSTSSHGMLSYNVLVSEKAPQPPPMVCYLTLYWFQRRPLNLLPWYVIFPCIGFREGPSTSSHGGRPAFQSALSHHRSWHGRLRRLQVDPLHGPQGPGGYSVYSLS